MSRIDRHDDPKKTSTVYAHLPIWGELFIDESGGANFRFHVEAGDFNKARTALQKFALIVQERLDRAEECPYFERGESDA